MPVYEYRCNACGRPVTLTYKSYAAYDAARDTGLTCPFCGAADLSRLISRVTLAKPGRDYGSLSSGEMLNVLEGGDTREIGQMFEQVGQDQAMNDPTMREVGERLLRGESPGSIERDLDSTPAASESPSP
ncbi:MAG: zinc ribbon domain-containing protein [Anaerolineae bacterium]